jgi:hypothetical protein
MFTTWRKAEAAGKREIPTTRFIDAKLEKK